METKRLTNPSAQFEAETFESSCLLPKSPSQAALGPVVFTASFPPHFLTA